MRQDRVRYKSQVNVERVRESPGEDTAKCEVGCMGGWDFASNREQMPEELALLEEAGTAALSN